MSALRTVATHWYTLCPRSSLEHATLCLGRFVSHGQLRSAPRANFKWRHRRLFHTTSSRKHTPHFVLRTGIAAMEQLEELPSVTRISKNVVRVLGQNPGKFTLQGTNTYLIGTHNPYTLIDTAEGLPAYLPVLESALRDTARPTNPAEPDVAEIIISHWHHDHVGGLPGVLELLYKLWKERNGDLPYTPPRLWKYPLPPEAEPHHAEARHTLPSIIASLPAGLYTPSPTTPFHALTETQILGPPSSPLHVLHTPGHTVDSIALSLPADNALYTADTVLGQGTAVFEDLAAYLRSLTKMLNYGGMPEGGEMPYRALYPAHGPVVPDGRRVIAGYIQHRMEREAQVLQVLKTQPQESAVGKEERAWTTWGIVKTLYVKYPESLWLPAARGIDLHLRKLEGEGTVKRVGGEGVDTIWTVVPSPSAPLL